jgi:hypothetical protein
MEASPPTSLSVGQIILGLLTASIAGGVFVALINRIGNWWSGRSRAEIVQINAGTVKLATEGQAAGAQMLMQAMERIRELVEINSELQDELSETGRQRDNFEYDLRAEKEAHEKLIGDSRIRDIFIEQLEAANKFGIRLRDLPQFKNLPPEIQKMLTDPENETANRP